MPREKRQLDVPATSLLLQDSSSSSQASPSKSRPSPPARLDTGTDIPVDLVYVRGPHDHLELDVRIKVGRSTSDARDSSVHSTAQPTTSDASTTASSSTTSSGSPASTTSSTPFSPATDASTPSPSIPPSPSSSSSSSGTTTTITSAFTAFVDGSTILTQTLIPTTIPLPSSHSSSRRTALIAGSAAGGTALLIIILSLAFFARRQRFKRLDFVRAITLKRKQERSRANMLAGEDLDDLDLAPPTAYTHYDTPWDPSAYTPMTARHPPDPGEDVWSPPTEDTRLMDHTDVDIGADLRRVVDDVMGPPASAAHFSGHSVSSMHRGSVVDSEGMAHSRTTSNASNMALLEAAGLLTPAMPMPTRSAREQAGA